ncbi:MAG: hypothetical protein APF81_19905 [Desulfosporosinus sp. BRH_c37]|nr:MAG: hypothetical protein APF81_19905 [Desulfosporosinus sp. BRH_c37]
MSFFTVLIIIWVIYQLIVSVIKKQGTRQMPGKLSDTFKLPNSRNIMDVFQGTTRGTWREQLKQALENGPYQAGTLNSAKPKDSVDTKDYYIETEGTQGMEGTQGVEGTQGIEGTSEYVGILGLEAYKNAEETPSEEMANNSSGLSGLQLSLTERELVQGVMWAEILGKPRAMRPFRGPRT